MMGVNEKQIEAMQAALTRKVGLIQRPPGIGKSLGKLRTPIVCLWRE